ncbi:Sorting and assembly machinery component 50 protein [Danaus plexippus plexippus]|uniref:Sorting and assembly machinery component 50 protein n=1 Tax=Danaus plexippus plexippus TaxID=278856 RepID=A0A212FD65_DANPL|nr:Sorting and assembly machinery component 50 protein [Danaus plexippus plexippus]
MGTVHAKADNSQVEGGLFDLDEANTMDPISKPSIKLNGVRARVDRVHVDGLSRTKDDIIRSTVDDLFYATDFEDVILRAHKVRRALDSMGCFKDIGVYIDVSSGPGATPEGLEVTFQVKELSRVLGGVNTTVSENEGNLVIGVKLPNVFGRGERAAAEYSVGHRSSSNFNMSATKPYPHAPLTPVRGTTKKLAGDYMRLHAPPLSLRTKTRCSINLIVMVSPQVKSVLRHIVSVDHRDESVFPTRGTWAQFTSELAGLGGGVANIRTELQAQGNKEIYPGVVFQLSGALGVLHDVYGTDIPEHFYLGGPSTIRGFGQRGVGPHVENHSLGGTVYWASGVHLYTPLPFQPGKGGLGELFRSHFFINGGCLAHPEESGLAILDALTEARLACGAGVALRLGGVARVELNYCVPLKARQGDVTAQGIQFGIAAHFL